MIAKYSKPVFKILGSQYAEFNLQMQQNSD